MFRRAIHRGWLLGFLCAFVSAPAAASFFIGEFRVTGNTVFTPRQIEEIVYPFLGPEGTEQTVKEAAAALEGAYRQQGYATVGVVVAEDYLDELRFGFVTLEVFEQKIDKVRITGAKYFLNSQIREGMPSLSKGEVLNTRRMQEELDDLSRRAADRRIRPVIKAGKAPGKLDVELQVDDQLPLHGKAELNNFASANTSDLRLSATVTYNNLFQSQDGISLSYQTSPENTDDVKVASATYIHRPSWTDAIVAITGVKTDSEVASVGGTTVLGEGEFLITRVIKPLRTRGDFRDILLFGFDYKNTQDITGFSRDVLDDISRQEQTAKDIDYFNFMLGYTLSHPFLGGRNSYAVEGHFGVRGLGNERDEFETKRFKGEPNYIFTKLRAEREQPLPYGMDLDVRISAQLTPDQLIGNEQMSLGGFNSVRGYLESEELADWGFLASVQLNSPRYEIAPDLPLSGYVFWDWGTGNLHEPLPDERQRIALESAGIGVKLEDWYGLNAEAAWSSILRDASSSSSGDDHVSFRLSYDF